jgi:hypothetical protein
MPFAQMQQCRSPRGPRRRPSTSSAPACGSSTHRLPGHGPGVGRQRSRGPPPSTSQSCWFTAIRTFARPYRSPRTSTRRSRGRRWSSCRTSVTSATSRPLTGSTGQCEPSSWNGTKRCEHAFSGMSKGHRPIGEGLPPGGDGKARVRPAGSALMATAVGYCDHFRGGHVLQPCHAPRGSLA